MADVPNDVPCAGCAHLASAHNDTAAGANAGACQMANCDCTAMTVADDTEEAAMVRTAFTPTTQLAPVEPLPPVEPVEPGDVPGIPFRIPLLVPEGVRTDDGRMIAPGALTARDTPLTLMVMFGNPDGGYGHDGALIGGRIDTLVRSGNGEWSGTGEYDKSPVGAEAARLARTQVSFGVSVDIADAVSEITIVATDEDGFPTEIEETLTRGVIVGATQCPMPAFRGCTIEISDAAEVPAEPVDGVPALAAAGIPVVAWRIVSYAGDGACVPCAEGRTSAITAAGGPLNPPAAWYDDPHLDGPTPLTVTDDGRVYGHLATWGTCHVGIGSSCVTPPKSGTDYAHFRVGAVLTAEGREVATGPVTLGTGHAPLTAGSAQAAAHYDNTGLAVADVAAGEDAHGIWMAGALRPNVTDEQVRTLRGSALSGDWRRIGRGLELVAALAVNVPGFPIPRPQALAASGVPMSLTAAGPVPTDTAPPAAGGDTTSTPDAGPLAQATEAAIDAMRQALATVDVTQLPDDVQSALAMLDQVDTANDALLDALGVAQAPDPTEGDMAGARVAALEASLLATQAQLAVLRIRRSR